MRVAVIIPCYNEEQTIGLTIEDFRKSFPQAEIVVCDNASQDKTSETARSHGARVVHEPRKGKGWAVRRLLRETEADYYIMTDGDLTYPAAEAKRLLDTAVAQKAHMVTGDRLSSGAYKSGKTRPFHANGNWLITFVFSRLFNRQVRDALSGLRVLARDFARSVPLISSGFEIETELTAQAIDKGFVTLEVPIHYLDRPEGSHSKLSTFKDGWRIIWTCLRLFFYFRPLVLSLYAALIFFLLTLLFGWAPVFEYLTMHYVYRVPSLIVSVGFLTLSFSCLLVGVVLEGQRYARGENFLLLMKLGALSRDHD